MNDTEAKLLEVLRNMRTLDNSDINKDVSVALLVEAITALAQDTIYAELALKIVAQYCVIFEPGVVI